MTLADLQALPEREVIVRLARDVMGWTYSRNAFPPEGKTWCMKSPFDGGLDVTTRKGGMYRCVVWNPFASISDAWMVVERMLELGWNYSLLSHSHESFTECRFWRFDLSCFEGKDDSAPRAIVLAALLAMGQI